MRTRSMKSRADVVPRNVLSIWNSVDDCDMRDEADVHREVVLGNSDSTVDELSDSKNLDCVLHDCNVDFKPPISLT
jgi:hypothetical protein